jgi:hypothetical protein
VFQVYPEGLATMRFSALWSVLFFMMVITLGIDSTVSGCHYNDVTSQPRLFFELDAICLAKYINFAFAMATIKKIEA